MPNGREGYKPTSIRYELLVASTYLTGPNWLSVLANYTRVTVFLRGSVVVTEDDVNVDPENRADILHTY